MKADFDVVLDACVLANFGVCDLFLRLAETPRLYVPKWTEEILAETRRTQVTKLGWEQPSADKFQAALKKAFPDSLIAGYEPIMHTLGNDEKDRHVLAAAIRAKSEMIVTFNLRHFRPDVLQKWGVCAVHPAEYLITLYGIDSALVMLRLSEIATRKTTSIPGVLAHLSKSIPAFCRHVRDDLEIETDG